ncbi:MAG: DUF2911 domain-containing protein [Candidatus Kapabacteria bacterium]|nr:DUF2911 domain-containing protein [Candidatus Kapabacteria bacterium]
MNSKQYSIIWKFGRIIGVIVFIVATSMTQSHAQTIPTPRTSQRAEVSQWIGTVKITINYSSPNVNAPDGENRTDKIWGGVVPFGMSKSPLGANLIPWRAGANENTVITLSHDVIVEGKKLPAGQYALFIVPEKTADWTVIFSKNSGSWGSFSYQESEDALRVTVKPQAAEMHEWLTYEFTDRKPNAATVALFWEKMKVPVRFEVPNVNDIYASEIRTRLRNSDGFIWQNHAIATSFVHTNKLADYYPFALGWIDRALTSQQPGSVNFNTLRNKAQILHRLNRPKEADSVIKVAVGQIAATPGAILAYGTWLLGEGNKDDAVTVFKLNAEKNPNNWASDFGLARMHSAKGDFKEAQKYAEAALKQAPEPQKKNIQTALDKLKQNKDMNV